MQALETDNYFVLRDLRSRVALVTKTPDMRQSFIDPETMLRLAPGLMWLAPDDVGVEMRAEIHRGTMLWARLDPLYKLYDCGDRYVVERVHRDDYAPISHVAGHLWQDPADFAHYNAKGLVMWSSQWSDPGASAHLRQAVAQGTLIWEAP